jgi:hypothetical protein
LVHQIFEPGSRVTSIDEDEEFSRTIVAGKLLSGLTASPEISRTEISLGRVIGGLCRNASGRLFPGTYVPVPGLQLKKGRSRRTKKKNTKTGRSRV